MMNKLFSDGTETLYLYRNDYVDSTYRINGDADSHHVIFYVETDRFGNGTCYMPVFVCSDKYLSYFFGVISMSNRQIVRLNEEDTQVVIDNIFEGNNGNVEGFYSNDVEGEYKPNVVIFGEFTRIFQDYTTKIVFTPEYHIWKNGGDNKYYDEKIGKIEFSFTFSPEDFLKALIYITVPEADIQNVLFDYLGMNSVEAV